MKSFLLYFPSCDSVLWGWLNSQSWFKGRVCKKARKTWDWIFSICLISLPVTWGFILHPSHGAAKLQPDHSTGTMCSRSESSPIFMCPVIHNLIAVRLVDRKLLFQRVQCIASVMAQKREQLTRTQKKTQAPRIGKQLSLKMECQRYWPALQLLVKD